MASYFHYMILARRNMYYTTLVFRLRAILLLIAFCFFATYSVAYQISGATFTIKNNCPFTVWAAAAAVPVAALPGGGRQLMQGELWQISVPSGTTQGRIWARTNCQFDASGKGSCQTGDCQGLLECKTYGTPPNTIAEYALGQFGNQDFMDISNIEGFNVPMELSSSSPGCNLLIKCMGDVVGYCPNELRVPGGCNGPCTVFKTEEHCCSSGDCEPTNYSKYFKGRCPDAYSYPKDDPTSTFTCPTTSNYNVTFCPCVFRQQLCAVEL